jgi:hypothetical protein
MDRDNGIRQRIERRDDPKRIDDVGRALFVQQHDGGHGGRPCGPLVFGV